MGVFVQLNEGSVQAEKYPIGYIVQENGCWDWVGSVTGGGYGGFWNGKRTVPAHRFVYEQHKGPIPEGLSLDHLCRNRRCVNPAHLEPVTQRENCLRGISPLAKNARKTHCPKGHEYTLTYVGGKARRACKTCDHLRRQRECKDGVIRARYWADIETSRRQARESYHRRKPKRNRKYP